MKVEKTEKVKLLMQYIDLLNKTAAGHVVNRELNEAITQLHSLMMESNDDFNMKLSSLEAAVNDYWFKVNSNPLDANEKAKLIIEKATELIKT